jgi:hypothetical protein
MTTHDTRYKVLRRYADVRGYTYVVWLKRKSGRVVEITAGCRTWDSFKEALAHYDPTDPDAKWSDNWINVSPDRRNPMREDSRRALHALKKQVKKWRKENNL